MTHLVVEGDLTLRGLRADDVALGDLVVRGNLIIEDSTFGYLDARDIWITGHLTVQNVRGRDHVAFARVRVGGTWLWKNNLAASDSTFSAQEIQSGSAEVLGDNRVDGEEGKSGTDYERCLRTIRASATNAR